MHTVEDPFDQFEITLCFNHPYWNIKELKVNGPTLSKDYPDVAEYLRDYDQKVREIEEALNVFKDCTFPNAQMSMEGNQGYNSYGQPQNNYGQPQNNFAQTQQATPVAEVDPINEVKKYKELLDMGGITNEEFEAKKKA